MISVENYRMGKGEPTVAERFYNEHMKRKMQPCQRLVIVPVIFGDSDLTARGSVAAQQTSPC
jgi:hypothetical protein